MTLGDKEFRICKWMNGLSVCYLPKTGDVLYHLSEMFTKDEHV